MPHEISGALYRLLLRLHPVEFRERFAEQMQWSFEQAAGRWGITSLITDAGIVAGVAGMVPLLLAFGSFLFAD